MLSLQVNSDNGLIFPSSSKRRLRPNYPKDGLSYYSERGATTGQ